MKILFLDVDGVLNGYPFLTQETVPSWETGGDLSDWLMGMLNPECIERLNRIIEKTGCKLVLSSTWRINNTLEEMTRMLQIVGNFKGEFVDKTVRTHRKEDGEYSCRGDEIKLWLDEHPEVTKFCILDDDGDMGPVKDHWVATSLQRNGLQDDEVQFAINMLGET